TGNERFRAETIEWQRNGPSFTFDTMNILSSKFPNFEFFFIIGADMIEYLPKWYKIEELIRLVTFIGVNRPNYRQESMYPIEFVEMPSMDISSSLIRERLKKGSSVRYLLPDDVIRFIKENHLYGT
ncbi:MAG: nicotinate-nucleotide adenylyltransferase, partial [Bacillota bacterium]|nr:nicotinate-nucleotide adenylyltransferase [Bacillota bacterium]